jgi:enoyl-CoA hydratase/carnithine racemase
MPSITRDEQIWTLNLGDDENRFSPTWLDAFDRALDEVQDSTGPAALVTIGVGKFFSNGLDVEWMVANPTQMTSYLERVQAMLARVLTLPVPTVAAVNGHAFGAGAILALAHDHRVMHADRGYFCLPEIDLGLSFTPGLAALIMGKTTPRTAVDAMTTGRRFPGPDALAAGLVEEIGSIDGLQEAAARRVRDLAGKASPTLGAIKSVMFAHIVSALHSPIDQVGPMI